MAATGWFRFGAFVKRTPPVSPVRGRSRDLESAAAGGPTTTTTTASMAAGTVACPCGRDCQTSCTSCQRPLCFDPRVRRCIECASADERRQQLLPPATPVVPRRKRLSKCANCAQCTAMPNSKFCSVDCQSSWEVVNHAYLAIKQLRDQTSARRAAAAAELERETTTACIPCPVAA